MRPPLVNGSPVPARTYPPSKVVIGLPSSNIHKSPPNPASVSSESLVQACSKWLEIWLRATGGGEASHPEEDRGDADPCVI